MTDRDDYDHDRMRREEDDYFAVTERPPQAIGQAAAAVLERARRKAKPKPRPRKPVEVRR